MNVLLHHAEEAWRLWPEMFGGFIAYQTHELRHKLFHVIVRCLPHRVRGGH